MLPQKEKKSGTGHDERLNVPEIRKRDQPRSQWELQCYRKRKKGAVPVTMKGSMCPKLESGINFGHQKNVLAFFYKIFKILLFVD
jgi:hypothetical protein